MLSEDLPEFGIKSCPLLQLGRIVWPPLLIKAREPLKSAELQEPVAGIFPRGHGIGAFSYVWQFL